MGLRMKVGGKKGRIDQIPMAAMPDIAFLLLMFFMVSTTFLIQRSLDVELPAYAKERAPQDEKRMKVFLAAESLRVEYGGAGEKIDTWELKGRVRDAIGSKEAREECVVLMEVDDDCPYDRVIYAFDAVRDGGGYVTLVEPEITQK